MNPKLIKIIPISMCMILCITCITLAENDYAIDNSVNDPIIHFKTSTRPDREIEYKVTIRYHLALDDKWRTLYKKNRRYGGWKEDIPYPASADKIKIDCSCECIGKPDRLYKDVTRSWSKEIYLPGWGGKNKDFDITWHTKWISGVQFNRGWIEVYSHYWL